MQESITDLPTKSHEYVFLLAKSERYFYDAFAVKQKSVQPWQSTQFLNSPRNASMAAQDPDPFRTRGTNTYHSDRVQTYTNLRTVWRITTEAYSEAHFATFPKKLAERCILAGTSEKGACPHCGAPWRRRLSPATGGTIGQTWLPDPQANRRDGRCLGSNQMHNGYVPGQTMGWDPGCDCPMAEPRPCLVLDPFSGAGTTGLV